MALLLEDHAFPGLTQATLLWTQGFRAPPLQGLCKLHLWFVLVLAKKDTSSFHGAFATALQGSPHLKLGLRVQAPPHPNPSDCADQASVNNQPASYPAPSSLDGVSPPAVIQANPLDFAVPAALPPPSTASSSSSYIGSASLLPPLDGPSNVAPLGGPAIPSVLPDPYQLGPLPTTEQPQHPKPSGRLGVKRRQKYTRTRTGCLTCRARRIKCDGARPSCRKCNVAKREVSVVPASPSPCSLPLSSNGIIRPVFGVATPHLTRP